MTAPLKILHCTTFDVSFGAGIAAYRLHKALIASGIDSRMLVQEKAGDDDTVIGPGNIFTKMSTKFALLCDKLPLIRYGKINYNNWNVNWFPRRIISRIKSENPHIVHLHWIGNGFIPIEALKYISVPIVWTFHDMWAFTGGCHYTLSCTRYKDACGMCPQLHSQRDFDLSRRIWNRKNKHWKNIDFKIVALNRWMIQSIAESSLLKSRETRVIPNCLDLNVFKPFDKISARKELGLPLQKKLILFGAIHSMSDTRKGYAYLRQTLRQVAGNPSMTDTELVVFGASYQQNDTPDKLNTHYMGTLTEEKTIALLYSAADVFIAPSIQDNLPNTVLEATACGTPSVAFNIGGLPDLIEHRNTGYLAQPFSTDELGNGIIWILENDDRYRTLARNAREKAVREFSPEIVAKKHINLYNDILHHQ